VKVPTLVHNFKLSLHAPANVNPRLTSDDLDFAIQTAIDNVGFSELAKTSFFTVEYEGSEESKCDACVMPEPEVATDKADAEDAGVM
jgi:hypothetical protein